MRRPSVALTGLLLAWLAATVPAAAQPRVGTQVPAFRARDLIGHDRTSRELLGRPTLVAVLTHHDARTMLPMLERAMARYPGTRVHLVLLLALDLSWFATTNRAIAAARREVPRQRWGDTWLDRGGQVQRAFGLRRGTRAPFVFVLDREGRITAMVRGVPTEDDVFSLWEVLPRSDAGLESQ